MKYMNLKETDVTLTSIVDEIAANQSEVVITRNGLPVARIVPYSISASPTKHYQDLRRDSRYRGNHVGIAPTSGVYSHNLRKS